MQRLTYSEFIAAAKIKPGSLLSWRSRGHLALAFGRREIFESLTYFEIDVLAHRLNEALGSIFKRDFAAQIVRSYFDIWGAVAARGDATNEDSFFAIVEFVKPENPKVRSHLCLGADTDSPVALARLAAATPQAQGYHVVRAVGAHISGPGGLIETVRADARAAGLDFSGAFLPPPNHPAFAEMFAPYGTARDRAADEVKALTPRGRERMAHDLGEVARKVAESYVREPLRFN